MRNTSDDEEKLDFEKVRSKFITKNRIDDDSSKKKTISGARSGSIGSAQTKNGPPRLLPKPILNTTMQISNEKTSAEDLTEDSRIDVKDAIRRFNNIGPRLFESRNVFEEKKSNASSFSGDIAGTVEKAASEDSSSSMEMAEEVSNNHDGERALIRNPDLDEGPMFSGTLSMDKNMHRIILSEMRDKGFFRHPLNTCETQLPEDIGRMRDISCKNNLQPRKSEPSFLFGSEHRSLPILHRKRAKDGDIVSHNNNSFTAVDEKDLNNSNVFLRESLSSRSARNTLSVSSSHSNSTYSDYPERDYDFSPLYKTGDENEDKRLRNLHSIIKEFYNVQKTYVELLSHIGESYPKFLQEYSKRSGKILLSPGIGGTPHVVIRISNHLKQILGVHRVLLDEFSEKYKRWDSMNPDFAIVLQKKAEFLKICNSFLKDKRSLCEEMQQALDENKELALATKRFEDNILNCEDRESNGSIMSLHGISIVMQLDSVHQNIVRYRLIMERYQKYLLPNQREMIIAEEALQKLTLVSNTVNGSLADADADQKLMPLYRKLAGAFNVFAPGRQLIYEGELQRQTRKDLQLRYLILFTDMLLICRYTSLATDSFDLARLYKIPIDRVRVRTEDHEDHEKEFVIISSKKSSAFVAKTKRERDIWVNRIAEATSDYRDKRRKRRSLALRKNSNSQQNSCEDSPDVENKLFVSASTLEAPSSTSTEIVKPKRNSQRYEALWIPDNKSTKCLMMACDTKFSFFKRKHHCRQCGWLICVDCVGYAPVKVKKYERVKVCPECYYNIKKLFEEGRLFPLSRIQRLSADSTMSSSSLAGCNNNDIDLGDAATPTNSNAFIGFTNSLASSASTIEVKDNECSSRRPVFTLDDPTLRIVYDEGLRYESPRDLFQAPPNGPLRKAALPAQKHSEMFLASGKVLLRNRKGVDVLRWARLTKEMFLQFFEAEFDDQPLENYFVYGYSLNTSELDNGGCIIELIHRNQFQTDRKEDRVVFQVEHSKSAEKWLSSLRECIAAFSEDA